MQPTVIDVAPGTHRIRASHTNAVLITDGADATLIDTGYPRDRELIESALREVGRRPADLSAVLLTHAHADHLGCAAWLAETWGVPVHCHVDEAPHARGEVDQVIGERDILPHIWRPGVLAFTLNAVTRGGLRPRRLREVTTFADGEVVDVPGRPVAVHTPGHTSGHAGFHLPDRGVLVTGDALTTVDVWDHRRRGPQTLRPAFNHDHERALASLERYAALAADVVLPGHGRPYRGTPAQAVAEARSR
ncbi:MBL fold metallo-hydrolase [Euzebya sp.]|uniref:MBL fold metallo-hydrolase n=1 Tax=Euzebya sp. TaxID=1971409 RepID=UPI00351739A4